MLPGFKEKFHPNEALLTDEERMTFAYFYCALNQYETALKLVTPLALHEHPNKEALKLYIALRADTFEDEHALAEWLITQFPHLGKDDWCDLWLGARYLNILLLEDFKLKRFYNCQCER